MALVGLAAALTSAPVKAQDLFVANAGSNTVTYYDPSGSLRGTVDGLHYPTGLAFNSAGDLFVSNYSGNTVTYYDPFGSLRGTIGGLNHPTGLAFNSGGDLFVSNYGAGTVTRYNSSGSLMGTFASGPGLGLSSPDALAFGPSTQPAPEPAGMQGPVLAALGFGTLWWRRRRRGDVLTPAAA